MIYDFLFIILAAAPNQCTRSLRVKIENIKLKIENEKLTASVWGRRFWSRGY
jgi:hypothetical protein